MIEWGKLMGKGGYLREGQPVIVQQCSKKLKILNSTHKMCARVQKYSFHECSDCVWFLFNQGCGTGGPEECSQAKYI